MFAALWTGCRSMFRGVPSLGVASLGVINRPSAGAPAPLLEPSPATAHATPPAAAVVAPPLPALCGPEMLSARHCLISSRTLLGRSPLLGSRDTTAHGPGTSLRRSHVSIQKGAGRLGPLPPHLANCQERAVRNSPDGGRASSWAVWALISASLTAPSRCAIDHSAQDGPAHQARPGTHACGRAGAGWCSRSGGPGTHAWPRGQTCSRWRCRPVRPCHALRSEARAVSTGPRQEADARLHRAVQSRSTHSRAARLSPAHTEAQGDELVDQVCVGRPAGCGPAAHGGAVLRAGWELPNVWASPTARP